MALTTLDVLHYTASQSTRLKGNADAQTDQRKGTERPAACRVAPDGESLVSKKLLERTEAKNISNAPRHQRHQDRGQSIMDRGAKALLPVLDVLVAAKNKYKILLMTGGGTRARHVYSIGG